MVLPALLQHVHLRKLLHDGLEQPAGSTVLHGARRRQLCAIGEWRSLLAAASTSAVTSTALTATVASSAIATAAIAAASITAATLATASITTATIAVTAIAAASIAAAAIAATSSGERLRCRLP